MLKHYVKHYVEFSYPRVHFAETSVEEVAERNPALVTVPETAFAYRFFDRFETDGDGGMLMDKNYSPFTYFGTEYTLKQVKAQFPEETILIFNMEYNGYSRVVHNRTGNWRFLEDGDKVI